MNKMNDKSAACRRGGFWLNCVPNPYKKMMVFTKLISHIRFVPCRSAVDQILPYSAPSHIKIHNTIMHIRNFTDFTGSCLWINGPWLENILCLRGAYHLISQPANVSRLLLATLLTWRTKFFHSRRANCLQRREQPMTPVQIFHTRTGRTLNRALLT